MPLPALVAVAGLAVAAHLGRKGSAANVSTENKKIMIDLVKGGRVSEARSLALELGLDRLDLSGVNLAGAFLFRANLANADLTGATLTYSNLANADLSGANLTNADLSGANLTNADLFRANLFGANLAFANLSDACLTNASLTGTELSGVVLSNADIYGAIGINIGPSRKFIGIPYLHTETKSHFVPGRTNLRRT